MNIETSELIVWLIVGTLSGTAAGALVTRSREGYGSIRNIGVGLGGALVGSIAFKFFEIETPLKPVKISIDDLIAAFLGSLLLLLAIAGYQLIRTARHSR